MNIIIDPELRDLIPPLAADERAQLEQNLLADGCRDPLVVWRSDAGSVLIDGHNRYSICQAHRIEFDVREMEFASRDEAADWIDANQLGRRNLTVDAFKLLLGRRYNRAKKAQNDGGKGTPKATEDQNDPRLSTAAKIAQQHGTSEATVKRAAKFAEEVERTPELKTAIEQGKPVLQAKRELKEQAREQRREENRKLIERAPSPIVAAKSARYSTIVIDPPWDWGDEGDQDQLGRARPQYGTMPLSELLELPVGDLSDDDCHIYLWITNRSLPKGFGLLERWGFRYVTALTWCKPSIGMGNYFRGSTEQVLFGVKGSQPLKRKDVGTWFAAPRGPKGHSSKPVEFYDLVESCSPGPYLEMFARSDRKDWTPWGAEVSDAA